MLLNAIIFGVLAGIFWVGFKLLWKKGPVMRAALVILSAPIFIFVSLVIVDMFK